jgi:hypothetical protein
LLPVQRQANSVRLPEPERDACQKQQYVPTDRPQHPLPLADTDAALMTREQMWHRPEIVDALHRAWLIISSVGGVQLHSSRPEDTHEDTSEPPGGGGSPRTVLLKPAYALFYRKTYLAVADQNSDTKINPADCMAAMQVDWMRDTEGSLDEAMDERLFAQCLFQLADLNTPSVICDDYIAWIEYAVDSIIRDVDEDFAARGDRREWRPDSDILDRIEGKVMLPARTQKSDVDDDERAKMRKRIFWPTRKKWEDYFNGPPPPQPKPRTPPRVRSAPTLRPATAPPKRSLPTPHRRPVRRAPPPRPAPRPVSVPGPVWRMAPTPEPLPKRMPGTLRTSASRPALARRVMWQCKALDQSPPSLAQLCSDVAHGLLTRGPDAHAFTDHFGRAHMSTMRVRAVSASTRRRRPQSAF